MQNTGSAGAIGVFYWEPTWYAVRGNGWDPANINGTGNQWDVVNRLILVSVETSPHRDVVKFPRSPTGPAPPERMAVSRR